MLEDRARLNSYKTSDAQNLLSIGSYSSIGSIKLFKPLVLSETTFTKETSVKLPLLLGKVEAGRPFFIEMDVEGHLDLNTYLIPRPASTYFMKVSGKSMMQAGINDADILVVDRSLDAKHESVVVAILNGELIVTQLILEQGKYYLKSKDEAYDPADITTDFYIWGVVTAVIHRYVRV